MADHDGEPVTITHGASGKTAETDPLVVTPVVGQYFTDFSEYSSGELPSDWTDTGGTGWKIVEVDGRQALQNATGGDQAITWDTPGSTDLLEIHALGETDRNDSSSLEIFGMAKPGAIDGFRIDFNPSNNTVRIRYIDAGVNILITTFSFTHSVNQEVCIRARFEHDAAAGLVKISVKTWAADEIEPAEWQLFDYEDTNEYSTSGYAGVFPYRETPTWYEFGVGINGAAAPAPSGGGNDGPGEPSDSHVSVLSNPYEGLNWGEVNQYKANFHTHTTRSDGNRTPDTVIADYSNKDYSILALTDHDNYGSGSDSANPIEDPTWPWYPDWISDEPSIVNTDNGMETSAFYPDLGPAGGMLAVKGNEISNPDHIGSFFNNNGDKNQSSERAALDQIESRNGLAMIYHPGRYSRADSWYRDLYTDYHNAPLIGMEVYNQGDRYPGDRALWDRVNALVMPDITIFGYSNDDRHVPGHEFKNYQFMLMEELTEDALRDAMKAGAFYFCYESGGSGDALAPRITSITVTDGTVIAITATDATSITWRSDKGQVGIGNSIDVADLNDGSIFVRAVLENSAGRTYTQPFVLGY